MTVHLVTGNAGFIGSHIANYLLKDESNMVVGMDDFSGGFGRNVHDSVRQQAIDLGASEGYDVEEAIRMWKPDYVWHLAADATEGRSQFTPISSVKNNLTAYTHVLTSCIRHKVKKVVLFSSMSVYGNQRAPFSEEMMTMPVDVYGQMKASMENMTQILSDVHGFDWTIIRPHNVFGPRQHIGDRYRNVVGIFMNRIMRAEPIMIYGDGEQTRAFSYIDNIVPACIKAGMEFSGEIFNIGGMRPISVNELANMVIDAMGYNAKLEYVPDRPKEVKHAHSSYDKSQKLLEYEDKVSLEDGIKEMADWAKKIGRQEWSWSPLEIEGDNAPAIWKKK